MHTRKTADHARVFLACLERTHPFNPAKETTVATLRKRTAWLLNERESGKRSEILGHAQDANWGTALDNLLTFFGDLLPVEPVKVIASFKH